MGGGGPAIKKKKEENTCVTQCPLWEREILRRVLLYQTEDAGIGRLAQTCRALNKLVYDGHTLSHVELLSRFLDPLHISLADTIRKDPHSTASIISGLKSGEWPCWRMRQMICDIHKIILLGTEGAKLPPPSILGKTPDGAYLMYKWKSLFVVLYPGQNSFIQVDRSKLEWHTPITEVIPSNVRPIYIHFYLGGNLRVLTGLGPDLHGVSTYLHIFIDSRLEVLPFRHWSQCHPLTRSPLGGIAGIGVTEQYVNFNLRPDLKTLLVEIMNGTCSFKKYEMIDSACVDVGNPQILSLMACQQCGRRHKICLLILDRITHAIMLHADAYVKSKDVLGIKTSEEGDILIITLAEDQACLDQLPMPNPELTKECGNMKRDIRKPYDYPEIPDLRPGNRFMARVYVMKGGATPISLVQPRWMYKRPLDIYNKIPQWQTGLCPTTKSRWLAYHLKNHVLAKSGYLLATHGEPQEEGTCWILKLKLLCSLPFSEFGRILTLSPQIEGEIISVGELLKSPLILVTENYIYSVPLKISFGRG